MGQTGRRERVERGGAENAEKRKELTWMVRMNRIKAEIENEKCRVQNAME